MTESSPKLKSGEFVPRGTERWWDIIGLIISKLAKVAVEEEKVMSERVKSMGRLRDGDEG